MPVFRWDIDKTYLETDFESLSGLWRAATESPSSKVTVDGASQLIQILNQLPDSHLAFLSGSPKQMHSVLLKKFQLDGIRVDEIFLKDSLDALSKGRLKEIKGQVGHKLSALVKSRIQKTLPSNIEFLFGDDVEQDALIYALYALIVGQQISNSELQRFLQDYQVHPEHCQLIQKLVEELCSQPPITIPAIFIRLTKHQPSLQLNTLYPLVIPVHCWSQAAVILWKLGFVNLAQMDHVFEAVHCDRWMRANLVQDLLRRGHLSISNSQDLFAHWNVSHASEFDAAFFSQFSKKSFSIDNLFHFRRAS